MPDIFVDTGAWLALTDRQDNLHAAAKSAFVALLQESRRLVTTNLVIAETYTLLRRRIGHTTAMQFLTSTRTSPRVEIVFSVPRLESEAARILRQYADQQFSYVDAVSFALMRERAMEQAFAFDHHFLICGFVTLPS